MDDNSGRSVLKDVGLFHCFKGYLSSICIVSLESSSHCKETK